jgi:hypothetical protein
MKRPIIDPSLYDIAVTFICMGMTFGMLLKSTV